MKKFIFSILLLCLCHSALAQDNLKTIPFKELGPAVNLPLNLTVPSNYVWVKKFVDLAGVVVLCSDEDQSALSDSGDFSKAKNAVISLRQSASDYFDQNRKKFSFEDSLDAQVKQVGGKNLAIEKKVVRDIPIAAVTFEVGERKVYSLAIAFQGLVYRLSYNAREKPRSDDDKIWSALVNGL